MANPVFKTLCALGAATLACACAAAPPTAAVEEEHSILQSSTPAAGSTVSGPVDQLELRFSPPARLLEVAVTGSDGLTMPMMVTAVGEVPSYALPLPGLGPGVYTVEWEASVAGTPHQGSFSFTVR